jgi:hypothetical protein
MSTHAPVRWVTHRLNGTFIVGGSYLGSRYAPLPISWPVAHAGAWIVSRAMPSVRDALVDNLRAVFPHESAAQLRQRAYRTCHTYTDDWMDFMRSLSWSREKVLERFSYERADRVRDALALGRGAILVTGHFGNWEAGAVLMKALEVPLTVVAMPEPDPNVNWIRHRVRSELHADTVEVRQSLDTALQIRRRNADGSPRRSGPRAGDDVRTADAFPGRTRPARVPDRRAVDPDLPGARRTRPFPRAAAGTHPHGQDGRPRRAGAPRGAACRHAARARDRGASRVLVSVLSVLGDGYRQTGAGNREPATGNRAKVFECRAEAESDR